MQKYNYLLIKQIAFLNIFKKHNILFKILLLLDLANNWGSIYEIKNIVIGVIYSQLYHLRTMLQNKFHYFYILRQ